MALTEPAEKDIGRVAPTLAAPHVTQLQKAGLLRLVRRPPVRGVVENFHRPAY